MKKIAYFLLLLVCGSFTVHGMKTDTEIDSDNNSSYFNVLSKEPEEEFCNEPEFSYKLSSRGRVAFNPTREYVASAKKNVVNGKRIVTVYDTKKENNVGEYEHEGNIFSIKFSPTGEYVASCDDDNKVIVYDIQQQKIACMHDQHKARVFSVNFNTKGKLIASGGKDGKVIIYNFENQEPVCEYKHEDWVRSVDFSPTKPYVASGDKDGKVIIYNFENQELVCEYKPDPRVKVLTYYDSKKQIIFAVKLYDDIGSVAFSPKGRRLASGGRNKVVVAKTNTAEKVCEYEMDYVKSVVFSPTEQYIASGGRDVVIVFDIDANQKACKYKMDWVQSVAFNSTGGLVCVNHDNLITRNLRKDIVSQNKPEKFSSHKEYLLWLLLHSGEMPTSIDQTQKKMFYETPKVVQNLFKLKKIKRNNGSLRWQLDKKQISFIDSEHKNSETLYLFLPFSLKINTDNLENRCENFKTPHLFMPSFLRNIACK